MNSRPLLLVPLLLASCSFPLGGAPCPAGSIVGMVRIDSAAFRSTNTVIPTVSISDVVRDGRPLRGWEATGQMESVGGTLVGIGVEGDRIVCTTACSFGIPGQYTFDVGAEGALTQKVTVAVPGREAGGCGGITTGTPVHLNLKFDVAP